MVSLTCKYVQRSDWQRGFKRHRLDFSLKWKRRFLLFRKTCHLSTVPDGEYYALFDLSQRKYERKQRDKQDPLKEMEQKPIFNGFKYTTSNFPDKDSSPDSVFYTTVYKLVQGIPQYLSMTITDLKDFEFL